MASSDDEGQKVPNIVSDYEFITGANEAISFAELPVEWNKGKTRDGKPQEIFLRAKTDNGLRKIYKQVIAWKFDLSYEKPNISVLSAEGYWIKLLKPWNPFDHINRTIQITLHLLHFVKWNPQRSQKALWDHLNKTFSMFERRPCEDDVADHVPLITEAVKTDEKLANSKLLSTFLAEKPWERKTFNEDVKPRFIVDDFNEKEDQGGFVKTDKNGDDESDEEDCFDHVCAICDDGGKIYICDGKCMRSFHATVEDGEDSKCESLGFTDAELQAIENVPFYCENCRYKKHQCFACGELGSSDESSSPEVFCCVNGACGFFYHPYCVAKLLHPGDSVAAEELRQRIAAGEPFACPSHRCHSCKELEVRSIDDLQFAVCRRCPRAYHRKCLPREITSEEDVGMASGIIPRAWAKLIPNRILIYCLDHEIDPNILTPVRDHIKFPDPRQEKKKMLPLESRKNKNLLKESIMHWNLQQPLDDSVSSPAPISRGASPEPSVDEASSPASAAISDAAAIPSTNGRASPASATTPGASPVVPINGASSATSYEASPAPSVSGDEDWIIVSKISHLTIDDTASYIVISAQTDDPASDTATSAPRLGNEETTAE